MGFSASLPLGYLIHEVARLMKRRFEEEARGHGITLPQWRALGEIATKDRLSQVALAQSIDIDPMTLSGILDRLEKRGLIERFADPNDSRAKLAVATKDGLELVQVARSVGQNLYERSVEGLSSADREQITRALERMRDNLTAMNAEQKEVAE